MGIHKQVWVYTHCTMSGLVPLYTDVNVYSELLGDRVYSSFFYGLPWLAHRWFINVKQNGKEVHLRL